MMPNVPACSFRRPACHEGMKDEVHERFAVSHPQVDALRRLATGVIAVNGLRVLRFLRGGALRQLEVREGGESVRYAIAAAALGVSLAVSVLAQAPQTPWRGAGPPPCIGT